MRNKNYLNLFLVLVLLMGMLPASAFPSVTFAEGEVDQTVGTSATEVSSQADLVGMSGEGRYILTKDITLTDWAPSNFTGTLDGNGYTITLNGTPLFDTLNGTVQNLLLEGTVTATKNTGALAYTMTGGLIQNIWSGASVKVTGYSAGGVSGLVGVMSNGKAQNILVTGELISGIGILKFGVAYKGNGASFDKTYWTADTKNAAQGSTGITNSTKVTSEEYVKTTSILNDLVSVTAGLRAWESVNGIPKPVGAISMGDAPSDVDKSELETTLQRAKQYDKNEYTAVSWDKLQTVITSAESIVADSNATQRTVNTTSELLNQASKELITSNNYQLLKVEIDKSEALYFDDYINTTWQAMKEAELAAYKIHEAAGSATSKGVTDADVLKAYTDLSQAIAKLEKLAWEKINTADALSEIDGNGRYILTADITGYSGNENTLTGKLDGNGHTIAFSKKAKPLFNTIAPGAEIRNVGILGEIEGSGAFAEVLAGKIFNSYSWADVDGGDRVTGGIAGSVPKNHEASISNVYVTGMVTGKVTETENPGGLIGESSVNDIFVYTSYFVNGDKGIGVEIDVDETKTFEKGIKYTVDKIKEESFTASLNKNLKEKGMKWNRNAEGLPYFGKDETPQGDFYPVVMTDLVDSSITTITNKYEPLLTSIFGQKDGYVASLALQGYEGTVTWKTTSEETNSPITVQPSSSKVFVRGKGTVTVTAIDANTKEEIQSFKLTAEVPENFELSLMVGEDDYTGKTYTTSGSKYITITPNVSVDREKSAPVSTSLFEWKSSNPSVINVNTRGEVDIYKDGSAVLTVSLGNISKTVTVKAGYIAVESIEPVFKGTYYIHGRSPNSIGQNDTPGEASFNPLRAVDASGEAIVGSELLIAKVTPKDATYAKDYTTTTDNKPVLAYKGSLQNYLLPMKEGTANILVTSNDPKKNPKPSGTSEVTMKYLNPLTNLMTKSDKLTVKKGETIDAGLIFEGPKSKDGYHVSESNVIWEQSGTGKVSATRKYPVIMPGDEEYTFKEGSVSNDKWLIRGVTEGAVTLTGTPADSKNGAKPITLNITVTAGDTTVEQPVAKRISEALKKTADYQLLRITEPTFGYEWTILGLARANYEVPENFYESYYASVVKEANKESQKTSNRWDNKVTEVQRLALALTAIGKDPRDVDGVNLLDYSWNKEANFPDINDGVLGNRQGSNELIFGLMSVEAHNSFKQPADASITIQGMIDRLIAEYQLEDGSFGLYDNKSSSTDMTAMAIQALAKHKDNSVAKTAADKAISKLSLMQGQDGGYGNSESTSQVILALTEMGIDPHTDKQFVKDGISLIDGQMKYCNTDGSFAHSVSGKGDPIATDQAFYTLAALNRFYNKEYSLYNMNDVVFDNDTDNKEVTSVTVSPSESNLTVDKTLQLEETILPVAATDKSTTWKSDNEKVATVSDRGLVKGLTAGTATITITTNNGKNATSTITVVNAAPPTTQPELKDTVSISVEKRTINEGDIISNTTLKIKTGDTAYTALQRLADERGINVRSTGSLSTLYVQAIDGLGEFDKGQGSGWMYSVNGVFPEYSAGLYTLKNGDILQWRYTTNLGADLNNPPPPTTKPDPKPESKPPVIEAPINVETVVKDNKVEIQIKDEMTGSSTPAQIENNEIVGDFLIVQIGGKGIVIPGGLELPKGTAPKVVVIDNDKPYEYYPVRSETKANKKWDVNFSGALLDSPENLDKVTVKDASGDIVDMKVKLSADGKTVSIHPSAEYEKGELYYITISGVTSAAGKLLKQDIRSIFIVE